MPTFAKASGRIINLENVTHVQFNPYGLILHPAGHNPIRASGEEAIEIQKELLGAGFFGDDNIMINPRRFVYAADGGSMVYLYLENTTKIVTVSKEFLERFLYGPAIEPDPMSMELPKEEPVAVSNDGNSRPAKKLVKKGAA